VSYLYGGDKAEKPGMPFHPRGDAFTLFFVACGMSDSTAAQSTRDILAGCRYGGAMAKGNNSHKKETKKPKKEKPKTLPTRRGT